MKVAYVPTAQQNPYTHASFCTICIGYARIHWHRGRSLFLHCGGRGLTDCTFLRKSGRTDIVWSGARMGICAFFSKAIKYIGPQSEHSVYFAPERLYYIYFFPGGLVFIYLSVIFISGFWSLLLGIKKYNAKNKRELRASRRTLYTRPTMPHY